MESGIPRQAAPGAEFTHALADMVGTIAALPLGRAVLAAFLAAVGITLAAGCVFALVITAKVLQAGASLVIWEPPAATETVKTGARRWIP